MLNSESKESGSKDHESREINSKIKNQKSKWKRKMQKEQDMQRHNAFCMLTPLEASHYEAVPSLRSSDVFVGASF